MEAADARIEKDTGGGEADAAGRGGVKEQSRLGRLLNGPDADLSPARAQHRRDYPLKPNHRPHLVRERQPSRRAPSVFFRGQQSHNAGEFQIVQNLQGRFHAGSRIEVRPRV